METHECRIRLSTAHGLAAGSVAGLVMSGWKMGTDGLRGRSLWRAPELIATILLGPAAYDGGRRFRPGPVVTGLALHEATSAAMGLAYVTLVRHPVLANRPVATAIGYALASWALYQYAIMPWLAPAMARHVSPIGLAVAHVVFGLALGMYAGRGIPLVNRQGGDQCLSRSGRRSSPASSRESSW